MKIKYFLKSMWGGNDSIMISNNPSSDTSYDEMYRVKWKSGKMGLQATLGFDLMSVEEMIEHIWKRYIEYRIS